jgi:hypothetical protein
VSQTVMLELEQTTCWCGTPFALPKRLLESARNAKHTIYCPHGHTVVWKETEEDRLRRERDRLKQREAMLMDENAAVLARAQKAEAAKRKLEKRAAGGVCPCCNRTFLNMQRHMKSKHPNVVPLEQKTA